MNRLIIFLQSAYVSSNSSVKYTTWQFAGYFTTGFNIRPKRYVSTSNRICITSAVPKLQSCGTAARPQWIKSPSKLSLNSIENLQFHTKLTMLRYFYLFTIISKYFRCCQHIIHCRPIFNFPHNIVNLVH